MQHPKSDANFAVNEAKNVRSIIIMLKTHETENIFMKINKNENQSSVYYFKYKSNKIKIVYLKIQEKLHKQ